MPDVIEQTVEVSGKTLIIYNNRKADHLLESDLYNPDAPVSGKVFAALYSTVIKTDGSLWYVAARNEANYSVTLLPCSWVRSLEEADVRIISYGNDRFCAYYDERTDPHKLVIDAKLLFFGNNLVEYTLSREDKDGNEEMISMYFDSTDQFKSNRVPMTSLSEKYPAYKYTTNCHTTFDLVEGDALKLRVYNNLGNLAAELTVFVRNAAWLNDLDSHTNPIVRLDATCLQMRGDEFYCYEKQDPAHLNIQPFLVYADGTTKNVTPDGTQCFIYGLKDYLPAYPGYSQTIVIKYFLNYKETTTTNTGKKRFITCTKRLVTLKNLNDYSVKLIVVPTWNKTYGEWQLRFFAYTDRRTACYDVTHLCTFDEKYPFDGTATSWGKEQHIVVDYDLQSIFHTDDPLPGAQAYWITVWDPETFERYTFRDTESEIHVYGADGSITRRPVVRYDATTDQYYIPTSVFKNWEAVVESFYTWARPPYDLTLESIEPTPTHFTVRDPLNGQMLIGAPIPASEFGQAFSLIQGHVVPTGSNILVEFLQEVNGQMQILYGVPVDVHPGTYNTEQNSIYP